MSSVRALQGPWLATGALLAAAVATAMGTACSETDGLPGGSWKGSQYGLDSPDASAGDDTDASMTGTPPATNADASPRSSSSDGGGDAVSDAAARASEAGDAGASGDGEAGMDLDTGSASTTFTLIDTTVTAVVQGQAVTGWDPIPESSTINLGKVGTALSIRANTTPATVGSVGFVLDGTYMHTEDSAPYTLCGDNGTGTVSPCPQLVVGSHTLIATPYSAADLGGTAMPSTTLYFKMVDDADGGDGG